MKKFFLFSTVAASIFFAKYITHAQPINYTVKPGDTMWRISVNYQIGISEILNLNPQISNANTIYAGQTIKVPNIADIKAIENEVIRLVNVQRSNNGLALLTADWQLSRVARIKSEDMRDHNYFSHYSPIYGSPFQMMNEFGLTYYAAGENIAEGQITAQEVMNSWMNSTGHRANILNPNYNEIGVGVAKNPNGTYYWTQEFIRR